MLSARYHLAFVIAYLAVGLVGALQVRGSRSFQTQVERALDQLRDTDDRMTDDARGDVRRFIVDSMFVLITFGWPIALVWHLGIRSWGLVKTISYTLESSSYFFPPGSDRVRYVVLASIAAIYGGLFGNPDEGALFGRTKIGRVSRLRPYRLALAIHLRRYRANERHWRRLTRSGAVGSLYRGYIGLRIRFALANVRRRLADDRRRDPSSGVVRS